MKKILMIAGTRPNFVKLAPLYHQLKDNDLISLKICHTGQHFDKNMSDVFWELLDLPSPDFSLNARGQDVPEIIGNTIIKLSEVIRENKFDLVVVFGDVNATVAGAITAVQAGVKVMHVEAGLRSFDRKMPEEVNRVITDHISDFLMVSEPSGIDNLKKEGVPEEKVFFVGNIMIECLIMFRSRWEAFKLTENLPTFHPTKPTVVATFHRPENVDTAESLVRVVDLLEMIPSTYQVVFPLHPRTKSKLVQFNLMERLESISTLVLSEPLSYFVFLKLVASARLVMTDSGGIQEETTFLGIPCLTFRRNTERPITTLQGTNELVSIDDFDQVKLNQLLERKVNLPGTIDLWDAQVSKRIKDLILRIL